MSTFLSKEYYEERYPQLMSLKCSTLDFKKRNQQFRKNNTPICLQLQQKKMLKSQDLSNKYPCPAKEPVSGRIRILIDQLTIF